MIYISTQSKYRSGILEELNDINEKEELIGRCVYGIKLNCFLPAHFRGLVMLIWGQNPSHWGHAMQNFPNVMDILKLLPTEYRKGIIFL